MKKYLFSLALSVFLIYSLFSQCTWQPVISPVSEDFVSLCITDAAHVWIVSSTGTIIHTSDGGITWQTYSFPDYYFQSIHFSDNDQGCIVGWQEMPSDSSLILKTSDGGDNWSMANHVKINRLNDVYFVTNAVGWAVGSKGEWDLNCCLYTNDGGENWGIQSSISVVGAKLYGVHFRDENIGSTCGADGAFFLTNNGGTSGWALGISMPILNLNAIFNFGTLYGCIVGDEGTVLYTINNWYQYIEQTSNTDENLNGVSGDPTTNKLWAVGDNGIIIYSSNYLLGWTIQNSGVSENLNDVCMLSDTEGWAVGDNGTILHFTQATSISHINDSQIQVYPNPANDWLHIIFAEGNTFQQMQIVNAGGQLIYKENMVNSKDILLDVSAYPTGIYFLKIINEAKLVVKKILIE